MTKNKAWIVLSEIAPGGGFVVGAFDNEDDARVIADAYSSTSIEAVTVGENEIEDGFIEQLRGNKAYWITVRTDGSVVDVDQVSIMQSLSLDALKVRRWAEPNPFHIRNRLIVQCVAPDDTHAVEIAKAQLALALAAGEVDHRVE